MNQNTKVRLFIADLKRALNTDNISIYEISDNLFTNVGKLGIDVYSVELGENISGALRFEENKPVIYLNSSDSSTRKRFTLAHELGHLYQHAGWSYEGESHNVDYEEVSYARNMDDFNQQEKEANIFAANLLMPAGNFIDIYKRFDGDIRNIAEYFNVSNSAVYNRMSFLKLNDE